ncbi:uncharacterized protein LOC128239098 [Mya arenaria]|uniref:uncharacterized protein LOC128239098 n=1 Tax=Mya arenaria TaxID=6604 RepID=UPI0022DEDFE8|nr:uncharacterized protein LOC128239098 [Mya arenaria]
MSHKCRNSRVQLGIAALLCVWVGFTAADDDPKAFLEIDIPLDIRGLISCNEDVWNLQVCIVQQLAPVLDTMPGGAHRCDNNCTFQNYTAGDPKLHMCIFYKLESDAGIDVHELTKWLDEKNLTYAESCSKDRAFGYTTPFVNLYPKQTGEYERLLDITKGSQSLMSKQTSEDPGGPGTGTLVGGALGGLAALLAALAAGFAIFKRLQRNKVDDDGSTPVLPGGDIGISEAPNSVPPAGI